MPTHNPLKFNLMTLMKYLLALCLTAMPVFASTVNGDDDLLVIEAGALQVFEDAFQAFLAENTEAIKELASKVGIIDIPSWRKRWLSILLFCISGVRRHNLNLAASTHETVFLLRVKFSLGVIKQYLSS